MIDAILDEIAANPGPYQKNIPKIAKLNIDERTRKTPPKFGIRGIPTLIRSRTATVEARSRGGVHKSQLSEFLDAKPVRGYLVIGSQPAQQRLRATDNRDGNSGNTNWQRPRPMR